MSKNKKRYIFYIKEGRTGMEEKEKEGRKDNGNRRGWGKTMGEKTREKNRTTHRDIERKT